MRISIDSNIFTTQRYGGISRYLIRLSEELTKMGNSVDFHGWLHVNRHLEDSSIVGTNMKYIRQFPKYSRRAAHFVGDLITNKKLANRPPDLIHESYYHNRMIGNRHTPRVCTVHDMIHELHPDSWGRMDRTPEYKRTTIERCDAVICVSKNTKIDLLRTLNVDESKVHVVHHGFEHDTHHLPETDTPSANHVTKQPFLLYVGTRSGYKNFNGFLTGLSRSKFKHELDVVAFGGGAFTTDEHDEISRLGFKPQQITQSSGDDGLLYSLYRHASAFVYPSIYEGFGMPPLESMSQGCPVISSNTSSMPEVIGNAAEFFDPKEPESITLAIDRLIESDSRKRELVDLGHNRLKNFSWKKCATNTHKVYDSII